MVNLFGWLFGAGKGAASGGAPMAGAGVAKPMGGNPAAGKPVSPPSAPPAAMAATAAPAGGNSATTVAPAPAPAPAPSPSPSPSPAAVLASPGVAASGKAALGGPIGGIPGLPPSSLVEAIPIDQIKPFPTSLPDAELVIIQMFGGDNNLSAFVYEDLQEMAAGIRGSKICVLGIADLLGKPGSIVEVTPDHGIQIIEEIGEIDTGDPLVLHAFLIRALKTHPNARKAIGFWDHGTGMFDETDSSEKIMTRRMSSVAREDRSRSRPARHLFFPKSRLERDSDTRAMLHDDTNGGVLTNLEAGAMLRAALKDAGVAGKIDMIFSDTCLNGMIEVLDEVADVAQVVVGSQDLEPGDGWDYKTFLTRVVAQPPATAEDWGQHAVQAFHDAYLPFPKKWPCTQGCFRTDHGITAAFADLLAACRKANGFAAFVYLDHARAQSQSFAQRDSYDLRDFAARVAAVSQQGMPEVSAAAAKVVAAYDAARVHSITLGKFVPNATGLSFYFPASRSQMARDMVTYERLAFARNSGWADFLKQFR